MEIDVEEDEPDDVVGESELEEPLDGESPVEAVEGDEAVDDVGDDPLLDERQTEVGPEDHLQPTPEEEELADSVSFGEVQFIAESRSKHEVAEVLHGQVVRPVDRQAGAARHLGLLNLPGLFDVHNRLHSLSPEEVPVIRHVRVDEEPSPAHMPAPGVDLDVGHQLQHEDGVGPAGQYGGDQGAVHGVDDYNRED